MGEGWGKWGQFTSNLRLRWTIPVTAGGCQVSRRGHKGGAKGSQQAEREARGIAPCRYVTVLYVQQNDWTLDDTSYRVYNNNRNE